MKISWYRWLGLLCQSKYNRLRLWFPETWNKETIQMEENEFHDWLAQAQPTCQLHRGQCSQMREILPLKHEEWPSLSYACSHPKIEARLNTGSCPHKSLYSRKKPKKEIVHLLPRQTSRIRSRVIQWRGASLRAISYSPSTTDKSCSSTWTIEAESERKACTGVRRRPIRVHR